MKLRTLAIPGTLAIFVSATVFFAGGNSAFASGRKCTFGSSNGNIRTCLSVKGSGLHITNAFASADVVHATRLIHVILEGPSAALPLGSATEFVSPGTGIGVFWGPNKNEPAGNYCAVTWRLNKNGSATQVGRACVNVHS